MSLSIDETYRQGVQILPSSLREIAGSLPRRLGISVRDFGGWEDLVRLEPNRNLPVYAAAGSGKSLAPEQIEAYCIAHHWSAVLGIVSDRMADKQVENSPDLATLRRFMLARWVESLTHATGATATARRTVARARMAWRKGLMHEHRGLRDRRITANAYAIMVTQKLWWISASAHCLLELAADEKRAAQFSRCYGVVLLSLQFLDDASDMVEDRSAQGTDFPTMLNVSPAVLRLVARRLITRAEQLARAQSFDRLADWLEVYGVYLDLRIPPAEHLHDQGNSLEVARRLERSVLEGVTS